MFDFITQTILFALGASIKKIFGRPVSSSGNGEMWIGVAVIAAVVLIVLLATRPFG
jgi:hypothetical protein